MWIKFTCPNRNCEKYYINLDKIDTMYPAKCEAQSNIKGRTITIVNVYTIIAEKIEGDDRHGCCVGIFKSKENALDACNKIVLNNTHYTMLDLQDDYQEIKKELVSQIPEINKNEGEIFFEEDNPESSVFGIGVTVKDGGNNGNGE